MRLGGGEQIISHTPIGKPSMEWRIPAPNYKLRQEKGTISNKQPSSFPYKTNVHNLLKPPAKPQKKLYRQSGLFFLYF